MRAAPVAAALLATLAGCSEAEEPSCELPSGLAVFPGAEGFGTDTPGGRGGRVLVVTTLEDSGPGSLREAVRTPGPRIVVFRVGGVVRLQSHLEVHEPFLTVAGQTAPGDGITLRDAGMVIFTHDVVVQHLRVRPGIESPIAPDDNDAIAVLGPDTGTSPGAHHVVLDHVSASWGEDETISIYGGVRHVTVSNCVVSEALNRARHTKGTHSAGLLLSDQSSCTSVHDNLLAHNGFRNPLVQGGGRHDVVNNVVYDWGEIGTEIVPIAHVTEVNLVGNTYLAGPSTPGTLRPVSVGGNHPVNHFAEGGTLLSPAAEPRIFLDGNRGPGHDTDAGDEWRLVSRGYGDEDTPIDVRFDAPFPAAPVTTLPADEALERVLDGAGATLPRRDGVDARVIEQVRNGTGRIIDSPADAGGYPGLTGGTPPPDADLDGMPDAWELARGLDPEDPADAIEDDDDDGYTNVEEHLHELLAAAGT